MVVTEDHLIGAMVLSPEAVRDASEILVPDDFHRPHNRWSFDAIMRLWKRGEPVDVTTVASEMRLIGFEPETTLLIEQITKVPAVSHARKYAVMVAEEATRRRVVSVASEMLNDAKDPSVHAADLVERGRLAMQGIETPTMVGDPDPGILDWLGQGHDEYDWVIPGVLERQDRLVLVAPEGFGKSMFMRQTAVKVSQGMHPFRQGESIPRQTCLVVDLENPDALVRRKMRHMVAQAQREAPRFTQETLKVVTRPGGLDLLRRSDRAALEDRLRANVPDVLFIGPLYKLFLGNSSDEEVARGAAMVLDDLRLRYGCAIWIEHHAPKASGGSKRDINPFGSSVWLRWPEFGLAIYPDPENPKTGNVSHFRGPRDERDWPSRLTRGVNWPWFCEYEGVDF